jgi:hypothetical protein
MKILVLFLLLPCCVHAQQNFIVYFSIVNGSNQIGYPTASIEAMSLDSTVMATFRVLDKKYPGEGDSLSYNGKVWRWENKPLHLYKGVYYHPKLNSLDTIVKCAQQNGSGGIAKPFHTGTITIKDSTMKAYSPSGNYLESLDSNHFKVYYVSTDTLVNLRAFHYEMSDSCRINQQRALALMRKKGCMQKQSCRDSIFYYQGKSISYLELERKFQIPDLYSGTITTNLFLDSVRIKNNPIIIKPTTTYN